MPEKMTTEDFLIHANELFGENWAYEISKRLSINVRTVQRYGSGRREVPDAIAGILLFWKGARND